MIGIQDLGTAGPVLLVLAALSLLSVAVFLARLIDLRGVTRGQGARDGWIDTLERGDAGDSPNDTRTPAGRVAARAGDLLRRRVPAAVLSADLEQLGNAEVRRMGRGIRLLELVGMIAPLLGLLGTVLGMIQSFRSLEMAEGAANASILAGGIWQALLTTAAGLVVAIPAVIGAAILQARVEAGTSEMERLIGRVSLARGLRDEDTP
ncbi:MotA/TolQ/ExbB proton channel family protein [Puniceibacterium sp. IMCC21224]|uniref:MotA/TolQ/ExbB proton channel family protein n=1 Tax=Puniceibacterium sp. IMCC21224 TaxID=1618204 RepID=UPI00064D9D00|nr:MotA/TolQ/ExbB proton channel family protein [Puniceibacterium sp. IMCC21224]KMK65242.1 biopolymer transport protein [Puniceibacterium sp. IMCC21224]